MPPPPHARQKRPAQSDTAKNEERTRLLASIHATLTSDEGKLFLQWLHAAAPIDEPLDAEQSRVTTDLELIRSLFSTVPGRTTLLWLCHIGGADRPVYQLLTPGTHIDPLAARVREGRRLIPAMLRSIVNETYHPGIPDGTQDADPPFRDGLRQIHLEILNTLAEARAVHTS